MTTTNPPCRSPTVEQVFSTLSNCDEVWASDDLPMRIMRPMLLKDLFICAQVCRKFNRLAVRCIMDDNKQWNPQRSCTITLPSHPRIIDSLSALLISTHIKEFTFLSFNMGRVGSLPSAEGSFRKIQRLVAKAESLQTLSLRWGPYYSEQHEDELVKICQTVELLLNTIVAKGCTKIQFEGFGHMTKFFKLKKAISSACKEKASILTSVKGYLSHGRKQGKTLQDFATLPDEALYSRSASRFAPWVSIAPSPQFAEISKIAHFETNSATLFQPPLSPWTFGLLKASPIATLSVCFLDLPDNEVERQLILHRLANALPRVGRINLDGAKAVFMNDIMTWVGGFKDLDALCVQPQCFTGDDDIDTLDLRQLHLPRLDRLEAPTAFICALLTPKSDEKDAGKTGKDSNLSDISERLGMLSSGVVATTYVWTRPGAEDITAAEETIFRLKEAIKKGLLNDTDLRRPTLHVAFRFDYPFSATAKALAERQSATPSSLPGSGALDIIVDPPSDSYSGFSFKLEMVLPGTREEIRQGIFDNEAAVFLRFFPGLDDIVLTSNEVGLGLPMEDLSYAQFDKFRKICPGLMSAVFF